MCCAGALMLTACGQQKGKEVEQIMQQRDSLTRVIEQKDNEINDMMGTMNDIEEGFRAINEAENRVTVDRQDEGDAASARIRENM